jgi:hypothetical protein
MATGDISVQVVNNVYDVTVLIEVTIEGFAAKVGTVTYANRANRYDFGDVDATNGNFYLTVTRSGYNNGVLTTKTEIIKITDTFRNPYPNETEIAEYVSGSDLVVRCSLSGEVYDGDTSVTATVLADWFTDGGDNANVASAVATPNNSSLGYPKVIGQWDVDNTPAWSRAESDFDLAFRAKHGLGVDSVLLTAIGATSSVTVSQLITQESKTLSTGSGLYHESYKLPVNLSLFTQGEKIDFRAIAYPNIGDAPSVLDTNDVTAIVDRIRGLSICHAYCDKTGAMQVFATVDPVSGDNGTGATTTDNADYLAKTLPYLTISAALTAGANVIGVIEGGTPDILGTNLSVQIVNDYYYQIVTHPNAVGTVTLNRSGSAIRYRTNHLMYKSISISYTSGNGWLDGENVALRQLAFLDVAFSNSATPVASLCYRTKNCYFINCTGLGTDKYDSLSSTHSAFSFTGNLISSGSLFESNAWYTVVANKSTTLDYCVFDNKITGNPAPLQNNIFYSHNELFDLTVNGAGDIALLLGGVTTSSGVYVGGNVIEVASEITSGPIFWIAGDGSTLQVDNVVLENNTLSGQRCNLFYNDAGSVATSRFHIFIQGNAFRSFNIKSDIFGANSNLVGNWMTVWGTNVRDNVYDGSAGTSFVGEYYGLRTRYIGALDVYGELQYVDERSQDTDGLGNGDYLPNTGSPLLNNSLPSNSQQSFDLRGFRADGSTIGARFIDGIRIPVIIAHLQNQGIS